MPLIWIRGDQQIGREVSALLKTRGIGLAESEGQASLKVSLQRTSKGIAVVLTDESGHWEERLAANPTSVANMIDAWVQDGLLTPNLPSRAVAPETSVGLAAGAPPVAGVSISAILGSAFDGSLLFGGAVGGVVFVGPVAFGPTVTVRAEPTLSGKTKRLDTRRTLADLTLGVSYLLSISRWEIRPGIDVGASFVYASKRGEVSIPTRVEEMEEEEEEEEREETEGEYATALTGFAKYHAWEAAVGAHFIAGYLIGRGFSFVFSVTAMMYPGADTGHRVDGGTGMVLAGQPIGAVYVSIGLEFGV